MTRVLQIEDDPLIRDLVQEIFVRKLPGVQLKQVDTLIEGRRILESEAPDLLLLDENLPDGHGLQWLQTVRDAPAPCRIPVVLVTGEDFADPLAPVKSGEVAAVLKKPFRPSELLACLAPYFGKDS